MFLGIPKPVFILGGAGLLPFVWGVVTAFHAGLSEWTLGTVGPRFIGQSVQFFYGTVILSFMSGVIWGFSAKGEQNQAAVGYALSVVPALWAFFMIDSSSEDAGRNLIAGFLGLLLIDWYFWRLQLAPPWWMRLRFSLTFIVILCLLFGGMA